MNSLSCDGSVQTAAAGALPTSWRGRTDYGKVFEFLIRDFKASFNVVDDHRDIEFVVSKINAHIKADLGAFKHAV